jgi:hypothetical protein
MKNSLTALLIGLFALSAVDAYSEPVSFKLRRTLLDKNTIEKPAQFQLTWPDNGDASYTVDAGINVSFSAALNGDTLWEPIAAVEYHRNNQIAKEQNTIIGSLSLLGVIGDISTSDTAWLPQFTIKYKSDEVRNSKSFVGTADISLVNKTLPIGKIFGSDDIGFIWQPRAGLEYENIFDANSGSNTGNILRGTGSLEFAVYPARKALDQRLELAASYQYWNDLSRSSALNNGDTGHTLFRCSAKYFLNQNRNYAIALEHLDGENPVENLVKQRYNQFAFQVMF